MRDAVRARDPRALCDADLVPDGSGAIVPNGASHNVRNGSVHRHHLRTSLRAGLHSRL